MKRRSHNQGLSSPFEVWQRKTCNCDSRKNQNNNEKQAESVGKIAVVDDVVVSERELGKVQQGWGGFLAGGDDFT